MSTDGQRRLCRCRDSVSTAEWAGSGTTHSGPRSAASISSSVTPCFWHFPRFARSQSMPASATVICVWYRMYVQLSIHLWSAWNKSWGNRQEKLACHLLLRKVASFQRIGPDEAGKSRPPLDSVERGVHCGLIGLELRVAEAAGKNFCAFAFLRRAESR
jgi:hypothetical protein